MCQQVQTVTLQTAILQQVTEFAGANTPFSVHDITVAIRNKTSQGELEIPEVEVHGASFRFDISHAKVKALFDELYRTGVFDPNYRLDRAFNGTYFEYTPTTITTTPPLTSCMTASVPSPAQPPVVVTPNYPWGPATVGTTTTNVSVTACSNDIIGRVKLYLENCATKNFRPSLKKIQSAIKRSDASNGYSCAELKSCIMNMGYTVVDDPDALSKSQVIV